MKAYQIASRNGGYKQATVTPLAKVTLMSGKSFSEKGQPNHKVPVVIEAVTDASERGGGTDRDLRVMVDGQPILEISICLGGAIAIRAPHFCPDYQKSVRVDLAQILLTPRGGK
jgi:hypothetical protein